MKINILQRNMKYNRLCLMLFLTITFSFGQKEVKTNIDINNDSLLSAFVGNYDSNFKIDDSVLKENNEYELNNFNFSFDCNTDFFSLNFNGDIQKWSLVDGSITGGTIIIAGNGESGSGLAYCGNPIPNFYKADFPNNSIKMYDEINGWQNISVGTGLLNNGGYDNHQYFMGLFNGSPKYLYYYDGVNLSLLSFLFTGGTYSIADIAVDSLGQAWVFYSSSSNSNVTNLLVYNSSGNILSYNTNFNSNFTYGSFFLNNILYVTIGDNIFPIIISGNQANLGNPISFPMNNLHDLAGCQNIGNLSSDSSSLLKNEIKIYPNPAKDRVQITLKENMGYTLYNILGTIIQKGNLTPQDNNIDTACLQSGCYTLQLTNDVGKVISVKVIKE